MKIHEVVSRLKYLSLSEQIHFLKAELRKERHPFSVRSCELESLLRGKVTKQLRREINAA